MLSICLSICTMTTKSEAHRAAASSSISFQCMTEMGRATQLGLGKKLLQGFFAMGFICEDECISGTHKAKPQIDGMVLY